MSDLKQLEKAWKDAEAEAVRIQNEKDDAVEKARTKYADKLRAAIDNAAGAQKAYLDRQVAEDLADRPDGQSVAASLVAQGGLSADAVKAAGIELPE